MNTEQKIYHTLYGVSERAIEIVDQAERALATRFQRLQSVRTANQLKVLHAMQKNSLSQADFFSATGYGYGDVGRDKTERIFRDVFRAEDAIMRASIASGTHALATVLFSLLERGDRLLAVTGHPYDTLQEVIGIRGKEIGTLLEKGVIYDAVPFVDGKPDYQGIEAALQKNVKLIEIQRSTGYTDRRALTITEIQNLIQHIRAVRPDVLILVDNCYGEFTEEKEPLEVGADVIAGSLIKNPGGGIAVSGGYIAGKKEIITRCINHLTAPGLGKDTGLTFGTTRTTLQGLFFAPHITMEALRGALLFAKTYESM
ncbi:MAG: methionine gamma-lyase family protein, partial [Peptoniphilaceae bacterium]|nr:methionine gamma-lyase family protein [Peptoniphilaceae bacterium]